MSKVASKDEVKSKHKDEFQLLLCLRDYNIVQEKWPWILDKIEEMIGDGLAPGDVRRWAMEIVGESQPIQRFVNAAKWAASLET